MSYSSDNSDCASSFWDLPEQPIKSYYKSEKDQESDVSASFYQESSSESDDGIDEKKGINYKEITNNNPIKKNGKKVFNKAEDKNKPFYVPRKPHFFEHDLRILDDEEEVEEKTKRKGRKQHESNCWQHDMFFEDDQKPKSKRELINTYGYDIRCDSPLSIGQNIRKDKRSKHKKGYGNRDNCPLNTGNYQEIEKENIKFKARNYTAQSTYNKEEDAVKNNWQRNVFKRGSIEKKSPLPPKSYEDVDILNIDSLCLGSSDTKDKLSLLKPQDRPIGAIAATFSGNIPRKDISASSIVVDNKKFTVAPAKYVEKSEVPKSTSLFTLSHSHRELYNPRTNSVSRSNFRDNSMFPNELLKRKKNSANIIEDRGNTSKSHGRINENKRVHEPLNFSKNSFRAMSDLEEQCEFISNRCSGSSLQPTYSYFNEYYNVENSESFEFPDPPDLSANHLMPCITQQQYYLQPYYQQGLGSLMHWGFYSQLPYYQSGSGSGITFVKQQFVGPWTDQSNQVITPTQNIDSNPYYTAQNDGVRCLSLSSLPHCLQNIGFLN